MPAPRDIVLGPGSPPAEDDLRLPRPPGVFRRFWARHPLLCDILISAAAVLLTLPAFTFRAPLSEDTPPAVIVVAVVLSLLGCVALVWRRRWPVLVFVVTMLPTVIVDSSLAAGVSGPASIVAIYSVAVYRSARACWIAFGIACAVLASLSATRILLDPAALSLDVNVNVSAAVILLLGALIGVNAGNRRRYLVALIERSRQLVIERDQQARLAAAAERSRIAREMHDVVSHSLTVIAALSEGAVATTGAERSRQASRVVADTAREALSEMRGMLGVLRDEDGAVAPLSPLLDASLYDVVEAARSAGFPATLTVSGLPNAPAAHRLAILRVVQEGLTNAMRYASDPSFIRVVVAFEDRMIHVSIENDGAGARAESTGARFGLQGLRERMVHVGGTLEAGMTAPSVWSLRARFPRDGADD